MADSSVTLTSSVDVLGSFATQVRSSVMLALDSVKDSSATLVESVKEKSANISVASISGAITENASLVKTKSFELAESVKEKSANISVASISEAITENAALVKSKSFEVAENMKDKSLEMADSMKKGAVAVAENVQGRVAPKTVKREGYLAKQVNGSKWTEYYFTLQDGRFLALPTQSSDKEEFSVELDCIKLASPADVLVTGLPNCFQVTFILLEKPSTVVNNWGFFNVNFFMTHKVNNQELNVLFRATSEDEMNGWIRDLSSTASGLSLQGQLKKTGEGATKWAEAIRLSAIVTSLRTGWLP